MIVRKKQFFFSILLLMGLFSYTPTSHAMFALLPRLFRGIFGYGKKTEEPKYDYESFSENTLFSTQADGWEDYGEFLENQHKQKRANFRKKKINVGTNFIDATVCNHNGRDIVQLPVLNQFKVNGGGGASSGYQTLKNSIVTILALLKKDIPDSVKNCALQDRLVSQLSKNLDTKLNDVGLVQQFFGNICGSWRKKVVLGRNADKLKPSLGWMCKRCLCDTETVVDPTSRMHKYKVSQFYSKALDGFAKSVARKVVFGEENFSFSQDDALEKFIRICEASCQKKTQDDVNGYYTPRAEIKTKCDLSRRLCDMERLAKYVDLEELKKISVSPDNYLTLIKNGKHLESTVGLGSRSLDGDWLDVKEIETLISSEKKNGMLNGIKNVSWLVYGDTSLIGTDFDANKVKLMKAVRKTFTDPHHKVVFCIGTMNNSTDSMSGSMGHWFPLVWSEDRRYVMDSLGNKCRLDDERVEKILDTFEMLRASNVISQGTMSSFRSNKVPGTVLALQHEGLLPKRNSFPGNKTPGTILALQHSGLLSKL